MAENYIVKMRLVCDKTMPSALLEFDNRWPRSLERAWSRLHFPATAGFQLEDRLNELIYLACEPKLSPDCGVMVQGVSAFKSQGWGLDHNGRFCWQCPVMAMHPQGKMPWEFNYDGHKTCGISVRATWQMRTH